ncbi:MAG: hypothetical protein ACRDQ1_16560 [Sciscionella sp.]
MREIAEQRWVAETIVRYHVMQVLTKMGAHSQT